MKKRRLTVALLMLVTMALSVGLVTGCAYQRADRSLVRPLAISKKQFTGEWYYMKTVTETPYEAGFFPGQGGWPLGSKIRWEITQSYLYAFNASPNIRNTNSSLSPIAAWPITGHFDIKPAISYSTGEPSNVIIEESRDGTPWYQRKYIRVMWSKMMISDFTDIYTTYARWVGNLRFERANNVPSTKFVISNKYMSYVSQEIITRHVFQIYSNMARYEIPMSSYRVKFHHSFRKLKESTYQAKEYDDTMFAKFGNFRTTIVRYHPDRGIVNWSYKFLANRHNIATQAELDAYKADPAKYPAKKQKPKRIVYYLSPNFPDDLMPAVKKVARTWNEAMGYALQRKSLVDADKKNLVFDILPNNAGLKKGQTRGLGDLRNNYLWYVNENIKIGLLGYGPSVADPDTGEIVHASAYLYGGLLRRVVEHYMSLYDLISGRYKGKDITLSAEYYNSVLSLNGQYKSVGQNKGSKQHDLNNKDKRRFFKPNLRLNNVQKIINRVQSPAYLTNMNQIKKIDRTGITSRLAILDEHPKLKRLLQSDFQVEMAFPGANPASIIASVDPLVKKILNSYNPSEFAKPHNMQRFVEQQNAPSRMNMYMAAYADQALGSFVDYHVKKKTARDEVRKQIMQFLFTAVTAHEIGHSLGLTHNFTGSTDEWNYFDPYHALKAGKTPKCKIADQCPPHMQHKNFYRAAAIMDYAGEYYDDNQGVGKTERASMAFIYNGLVEKGVDDPTKQGKLVKWDAKIEQAHQVSMSKNPNDPKKWVLREFRFCSDYMVGQDPYCKRRDSGHNAEEIVKNIIANYDRVYPLTYWRRGRRSFGPSSSVNRTIGSYIHIAEIYQDWTYRVITTPGYKDTDDFKHKLKAIQKGYAFFMRILGTPRIGTHYKRDGKELWEHRLHSSLRDQSAPTVDVELGTGRYFYSAYNSGYFGIFRFRRTGTLYDKMYATLILSVRSWGYNNNNINWIHTNFYDLFREDTTDFYSQAITGVWDEKSPLLYTAEAGGKKVKIAPAWHPFLQMNGMLYALAYLTNRYSDSTFGTNMCVGIEGHGKAWTPPGMDKVSCPPPAHLKDRISCFKNYHQTRSYFAVQNKEKNSIAWKMVKRGEELASELKVLRQIGADRPSIDNKEGELKSIETYLTIMQQYVSMFGGC